MLTILLNLTDTTLVPVLAQSDASRSERWVAVLIAIVLVAAISIVSCLSPKHNRGD